MVTNPPLITDNATTGADNFDSVVKDNPKVPTYTVVITVSALKTVNTSRPVVTFGTACEVYHSARNAKITEVTSYTVTSATLDRPTWPRHTASIG